MQCIIIIYIIQLILMILVLKIQKNSLDRLKKEEKISKKCSEDLIYIFNREIDIKNNKIH